MRYAIDSRKLPKKLGWEPSLLFEESIEETVKWYLENQECIDHVTSGEYQKYYDNMYKDRLCLFPKIIPSFFTIKEGSTSLTKPLSCPKREDVTALQCYICPTCPSPAGGSLPYTQALNPYHRD